MPFVFLTANDLGGSMVDITLKIGDRGICMLEKPLCIYDIYE